jgi:hypothetical protein
MTEADLRHSGFADSQCLTFAESAEFDTEPNVHRSIERSLDRVKIDIGHCMHCNEQSLSEDNHAAAFP